MQVSELVYLYLDSSGQHEVLLGTLHFAAFVQFLISRKLMDALLVKTLQVNRYYMHLRFFLLCCFKFYDCIFTMC